MPTCLVTNKPASIRLEQEYRYFCPGCTEVAFMCIGTKPKDHPGVCQHCGIQLTELKPENFLPLENLHPERIAQGAKLYY